MILNETGGLAQNFWMEIPNHFPFITLGAFVVMPNHVHGIIEINKVETSNLDVCNENYFMETHNVKTPNLGNNNIDCIDAMHPDCKNAINRVDMHNVKRSKLGVSTNKKWKPGVLGVILNQYKRIYTINARKTKPNFKWQTQFHDHIIRDFDSYHRIEQYIQNNPQNWQNDKLY